MKFVAWLRRLRATYRRRGVQRTPRSRREKRRICRDLPEGYARILYRKARTDHSGTVRDSKVDKLREIASLEIDLLCLGLGPNATVGIRLLGASRLINGMERAASRKNGSKRKDLENPYGAHWRYFSKKHGSRQYAAPAEL